MRATVFGHKGWKVVDRSIAGSGESGDSVRKLNEGFILSLLPLVKREERTRLKSEVRV
jgi:hypothetical protein